MEQRLSRPELCRRTRKRLKLQKMGQRRGREDDRSIGAEWHAGPIMQNYSKRNGLNKVSD